MPTGRTAVPRGGVPGPAPPPARPSPPEDPIWSVKLHATQGTVEILNGLTLTQVRELILADRLLDTDHLKVYDGDWTPSGALPILEKFFTERLEQLRELHGDENHCAHHKDAAPGWQCLKCSDYLCERCVMNRPLLEGGEARYLCLVCDFETRSLGKKAGIGGVLKGILKKK